MGIKWFVAAVFIVSGATFILAAFIGEILDFFKWPPPHALDMLGDDMEEEDTGNVTSGSSTPRKGNGSATSSQQPTKRRPPRNMWRIMFPAYVERTYPKPKSRLPSMRIKSMREKSALPASSAP